MQFLEQHATPNAQASKGKRKVSKDTAAMIAIRGSQIVCVFLVEQMTAYDMKLRRGTDEWWSDIKRLAEVMGGRAGIIASRR